jgi:hypothetical protein
MAVKAACILARCSSAVMVSSNSRAMPHMIAHKMVTGKIKDPQAASEKLVELIMRNNIMRGIARAARF